MDAWDIADEIDSTTAEGYMMNDLAPHHQAQMENLMALTRKICGRLQLVVASGIDQESKTAFIEITHSGGKKFRLTHFEVKESLDYELVEFKNDTFQVVVTPNPIAIRALMGLENK